MTIHSEQDKGEWLQHITATLEEKSTTLLPIESIAQLQEKCPDAIDTQILYEQFATVGLHYGPSFQCIVQLQRGSDCALTMLKCDSNATGYICHPALLDAALQSIAVLAAGSEGVYLPWQVDHIQYQAQTDIIQYAFVELVEKNPQQITANVLLLDALGRVAIKLSGFKARHTSVKQLQALLTPAKEIYVIPTWQEVEMPAAAELTASLIVEDLRDEQDALAASTKMLKRIQEITQATESKSLIILATGLYTGESAVAGGLLGLIKTALQEYPLLDCRLVDTDNTDDIARALSIKEPIQAFHDKKIYVHRLTTPNKVGQLSLPDEAYALVKSNDNTIAQLSLELQAPYILENAAIEIAVSATGLNFRDVLNALGLYPGDPGPLGGEVAGIVTRVGQEVKAFKPGDAVFGMSAGGFRSYAITHAALITRLPSTLSFTEAAGLPIVYLTAYEGLMQLAKIKRGDKVLIHAGTGGVGLAAIQLAKHVGAEIYATASESKQDYLRSIGITHIYNSRNTEFGKQIMADTHNQGVDVILNSLTSDGFIEASLSCLKKQGVFLEIGKRNIYTAEQMQNARADVDYHIIAIDDLAQQQPAHIQVMLEEIRKLFESQAIHALPMTVYPIEQVKAAFTCMQKAKHVGKIIVTQPQLLAQGIDEAANYLITGGLGGLGLFTAKWLAQLGAKHIVLVSRSKPNTEKQAVIDAINADIKVISADISVRKVSMV